MAAAPYSVIAVTMPLLNYKCIDLAGTLTGAKHEGVRPMKPIKTRYTNRILGAPDGWNVLKYSPCVGLPLILTKTGPGDTEVQYHSNWKTSWRERFLILLGRPITLGINGGVHPPVSLFVTFRNEKPAESWNPEHDVDDDKTPIKAVS